MVDRLDRYVTGTVAAAYAAALLFMVLLFVLMDLLLNLGVYLDRAHGQDVGFFDLLTQLARYYGASLPVLFVIVGPFVSVIAGMFAVSRLMSANEIVPMLFTGRSTLRVLRPVILAGIASAVTMAVCWEWAIPRVSRSLHELRAELGVGADDSRDRNIVVKVRGDRHQTLIVDFYDPDLGVIDGVTLVDRGTGPDDTLLISASSGVWDAAAREWVLTDGVRVEGDRESERSFLGMPEVDPDLLFRLGRGGHELVELSYSDLRDLQLLRPGRTDYVLGYHAHLTFPLANLILLLLALPFAVHFERGGRMERTVVAILLCAAYLVADLTCQNLGRTELHPVLAAWLPTIVFGSFGVVFFSGIKS